MKYGNPAVLVVASRENFRSCFGGCVTYKGVPGVGSLVPVDGNIDSHKYITILQTSLWPMVSKHFTGKRWLFQDDNAPVHRSAFTKNVGDHLMVPVRRTDTFWGRLGCLSGAFCPFNRLRSTPNHFQTLPGHADKKEYP